jgi:hypothetical protein
VTRYEGVRPAARPQYLAVPPQEANIDGEQREIVFNPERTPVAVRKGGRKVFGTLT